MKSKYRKTLEAILSGKTCLLVNCSDCPFCSHSYCVLDVDILDNNREIIEDCIKKLLDTTH